MPRIIITLTLMLVLSAGSFSQQTNPSSSFSEEEYLRKSKHQKTTAHLLLGGGAMLTAAGMIIGFGDALNTIATIFSPEEASSSNTGEVIFYTGLVVMAGSIPLFIASSRNKNRALRMSASLKMETRSQLRQDYFARTAYPALALKLRL